MEYIPYSQVKYYKECASIVEDLGYRLVDLKIVPGQNVTKISAIVTTIEPNQNMGVNDCAKVHRVLLPRLEELLGTEETSMELTSPGIEHNIKNAREFFVFINKNVRVWDKTVSDWIGGKIISTNETSLTLEKEGSEQITILFENIAKAKFITE